MPLRLFRLSFSVAILPSCDDSCSTWLSIVTIFCFCFCLKRLCADLFFSCTDSDQTIGWSGCMSCSRLRLAVDGDDDGISRGGPQCCADLLAALWYIAKTARLGMERLYTAAGCSARVTWIKLPYGMPDHGHAYMRSAAAVLHIPFIFPWSQDVRSANTCTRISSFSEPIY